MKVMKTYGSVVVGAIFIGLAYMPFMTILFGVYGVGNARGTFIGVASYQGATFR